MFNIEIDKKKEREEKLYNVFNNTSIEIEYIIRQLRKKDHLLLLLVFAE
jgi:hypothetical protein